MCLCEDVGYAKNFPAMAYGNMTPSQPAGPRRHYFQIPCRDPMQRSDAAIRSKQLVSAACCSHFGDFRCQFLLFIFWFLFGVNRPNVSVVLHWKHEEILKIWSRQHDEIRKILSKIVWETWRNHEDVHVGIMKKASIFSIGNVKKLWRVWTGIMKKAWRSFHRKHEHIMMVLV